MFLKGDHTYCQHLTLIWQCDEDSILEAGNNQEQRLARSFIPVMYEDSESTMSKTTGTIYLHAKKHFNSSRMILISKGHAGMAKDLLEKNGTIAS